ncbi:PH domain [Trypanosoma vivax]|nr:PH domain [Trypanosoma vivax]
MQQCSQKTVKSNAISDIAALVGQDPAAWKSVVSLPGWYMRLADLYLSDEELHKETEGSKSLLESAAFIFSRCIFHSLLQETYGASEMRLLVTYLLKQCACALLNAILLGVVKDYTNYFMNRREHVRSAHLGLGSTLAVCNFASFLFIVEDVLFYSHTASQVLGATCQLESHRKRGYTEIKELVVCCTSDLPDSNHRDGATKDIDEDQNGLREGEQCSRSRYRESVSYFSGDTVPVSVASEGIWLHSELAVRVMCLLTSDGVLLKSGCAVNDNASGPSSSEFAAHEPPGRKGGFIRLFTRLFRVVCTFALRDTELVDNILLCSMRWVELVEEGPGPFSVLAWQTATLKKHSSLSCSMAIVLSLHELLNRRLRFSLKGPSARYRDVNVEILERIKSICTHYKNALSQMQVFRMEVPRSDGGHSVQKHTLQWLCSYSSGDLVREFVEVASRQDYNAFLSQCTLATELDQVTDKSITRSIEQEQEKAVSRLHGMVTSLSMSRKAVLEALEQYLQQVCKSATLDADGSAKGAEAKASAERFTPHAARAIATVTFNAVWVRFLNRCSGTIWDPDPGRQLGTRFVRMMEVEQQLLLRRKLEFDPHGTNHADIMAVGSPPLTVLQKERQPPSLRGGEQLLLSPDGAMGDEDAEGLGVEVMDNATSSGTMHEVKPVVHFSMPCEAPYLMHCWSATLTIRDCELCVFFDDENKAYNQRIAEEAASLLIKPRSIIYPSGRVAMLAPGRRFRMQRTAVELWFRDGRSVLLNFSSAADMRAAVSCIRAAIERHKVPYHSFCVFNENPKKETRLALYTEQWRERTMTNFDYLLWLNFFAGRTLNDLTQYPVFPWVIADYKSEHLDLNSSSTFRDLRLPVGICGGPQCRERVKTRYEETRQMGDVPAHYFTHYSSPAVVIYYMTRIEPFTTLQIILQGGHFDHADRMFHSLPACWHGISTNSQDVRELIPELYYLPELCTNTNGVHFGAKQDGQPMNALDLPPWAHGDPYEFIFRMREALESDHVSSTLNHWIDLIFGYKQRGKEAIEAVNVFNWHSYEDLDKNLSHDIDHKLLIDSLDNIGQTPIQLFTQPHVARRHMEPADPAHCSLKMKTIDLRRICSRINRATRISHVSVLDNDRLLVVCGNGAAVLCRLAVSPVMRNARSTLSRTASARAIWPQKDARHSAPIIISSAAAAAAAHVSTSVLGRVGTAYISTSQNCRASGPTHSSLDVFEEVEKFMAPLPPGLVPNIGNKSGGPCEGENIAVLCLEGEVFVALGGLFDNTLLIRPFGSSSSFPEEYLKAHCGRVVRVVASPDSRYIVSGAEDTTFVVWSVNVQPNRSKLHVNLLFAVYGHEGNPTAMDICPGVDLVVTASSDGMLMFHSIQNSRLERSLRHPSKLSIDRVLIQHTCYLPNILFTSSSDNVVHQVSMNGAVLRSVPAPGHITWWCRTPRQSVLLVTAPVRGDGASEKGGASLHYLHAFYLSTLKSVSWPLHAAEDVLSCCAVHSRNPQVVVCGSSKGSLSLMHVQRES